MPGGTLNISNLANLQYKIQLNLTINGPANSRLFPAALCLLSLLVAISLDEVCLWWAGDSLIVWSHFDDYIGPGSLFAPPEVEFPMRSWPLLLPTISLLSLFLFFSLRLLILTPFGETPEVENLFLEDICKKKIVNLFFLRKKGDFSYVFSAFYGQRSVTAAWATRSPWSITNRHCILQL